MRPGGQSSLQDYNSDFRTLPSAPTSGCNSLFLRVLLLRLALVLPQRHLFLGPCSLTTPSWPHPPLLPSAPSGWTTLLLDWSGCLSHCAHPLGHPSSQILPPDLPSPPLYSAVCLSPMTQVLKPPVSFPATNSLLSDQIRSVAQSCPTLCDPVNHSTPGLPVHHQLPEFTETSIESVMPSSHLILGHPLLVYHNKD